MAAERAKAKPHVAINAARIKTEPQEPAKVETQKEEGSMDFHEAGAEYLGWRAVESGSRDEAKTPQVAVEAWEKAQRQEAKAYAWSAKKAEADGVQVKHEGSAAEVLGRWSRQRSRPRRGRRRRRRRHFPL